MGLQYLNICRCVCYKSVYGFWASKSKSTNDYLDLQCVCVCMFIHISKMEHMNGSTVLGVIV